MEKKRLSIALVIGGTMLLSACGTSGVSSVVPPASSSDTSSAVDSSVDPVITINTPSDLQQLKDSKEKFALGADLDFTDVGSWTTITGFEGTLDGNNHEIKNFNFSFSSGDNIGLFAVNKGTIKNLSISGELTVTGECENIGLLAGSNEGTLEAVTSNGKVTATYSNKVGGIVGTSSVNISKCVNNAEVAGLGTVGGVMGQLSGYTKEETLKENKNTGKVTGSDKYVGGIAGYALSKTPTSTKTLYASFEDNENSGEIIGSKDYVGGLLGYVDAKKSTYDYQCFLDIKNSKNSGSVSGANYVGGIVGGGVGLNTLSACENKADITGSGNYVGGYVGGSSRVEITLCNNENKVSGSAYVGGIAGEAKTISKANNKGEVVSKKVYIEESTQLAVIGGIAGKAKLINECKNEVDITVLHEGTRVGGIAGELRGMTDKSTFNDNTNTGNINAKGASVGGLVGYVLNSSANSSDHYYTTSENNKNEGDVTSLSSYVGGLFGFVDGKKGTYGKYSYLSISNSENKGAVSGASYVGGILGSGFAINALSACTNEKDVTGTGSYVGGFAGKADNGVLKLLTNNVKVTGKAYVGGIAGSAKNIEKCINNGTVESTGYVLDGTTMIACLGGIAGIANSVVDSTNNGDIIKTTNGNRVGGIVGELSAGPRITISGNSNKVDISALGNEVGGIIGHITIDAPSSHDSAILAFQSNSNEGNITSEGKNVGGLVGRSDSQFASVFNYYSTLRFIECENGGNISGEQYVGGLLGSANKVTNTTDVWSTNTQSGEVTGTNSGNYYGSIY